MDSPTVPLGGLPAFLDLLGTSPTPAEVATALVEGPGRVFDAAISAIFVIDGDALRVVARHGYSPADPDARYSLWADLPVSEAVREGAVVVRGTGRAEDEFTDLVRAWNHAPELASRQAIVSGPIILRAMPVGGYFMACDSPPTWDSLGYALLDGIGRALGLWLARDGAAISALPDADASPELTPRQLGIVRMLAGGRTTPAIAASLGCSVSTIKADIQRISRLLGASGRTGIVERARVLGLVEVASPEAAGPGAAS